VSEYLVFDLEIKNAIPTNREPRVRGVRYCRGWEDYAGMGIATVCAYDYVEQRFRVFTDSNKEDFFSLLDGFPPRKLVSFNGKHFDVRVVEACWEYNLSRFIHYDLLALLVEKVGERKGRTLEKCAQANLQVGKVMEGKMAPVEWQTGSKARVIDYCLDDVRLTTLLWEKVLKDGGLIDPVTKRFVRLDGVLTRARQQNLF